MYHILNKVSAPKIHHKSLQDMKQKIVEQTIYSEMQIPLHRITDSASNGSVFPVVTEHFSASSDHAFL